MNAHRIFKRARRKLGGVLIPWLAPSYLGHLSRSWRYDIAGLENYTEARQAPGLLIALWHGRMLMGLHHHRGNEYAVLVSPSDDGSLVKPLLLRFGYRVIRGSSSRGGARALREMLEELNAGGAIVVTPDGPRGPRHSMNPGLAWMARATGFPILPMGFACDSARRLKSWDAFTIPRWRARVAMTYGPLLRVARRADERELEETTRQVGASMMAAERASWSRLGLAPDWNEEPPA